MTFIRRIGHLLMAWIFINGGIDTMRKPEGRAALASGALQKVRDSAPFVGADDLALVRANAVVQVAAGAALAAGKFRRLSSLALVGSLVPTTIAGHAFWKLEDKVQRAAQRTHFNKNLALIGGLLVSATEPPAKRCKSAHSDERG